MTTLELVTSHLDSAFRVAADTFAATADQRPDGPTPCTEFTVGDLRAHLLAVGYRIAAMGRGEPALSTPDRVPAPGGDWSAAFADSWAQARTAWATVTDDTRMEAPWRSLTAAEAAGIYASELVVHSWDLARASGRSIEVADEVLATCLGALDHEVPAAGRAEFWERFRSQLPPGVPWSDPFAPVPVGLDGLDPLDRLVAVSGRDPRWSA